MSFSFFNHRTWQTRVHWFVGQGKQPQRRINICSLQQNQNLTRISYISDLINLINAATTLINTSLLSDMFLSIPFRPPLALPRQQLVFGELPLPWAGLQQWPLHPWGKQWWPCTVTPWLWRQLLPKPPWQRSGNLPELPGLTQSPRDGVTVIATSLINKTGAPFHQQLITGLHLSRSSFGCLDRWEHNNINKKWQFTKEG